MPVPTPSANVPVATVLGACTLAMNRRRAIGADVSRTESVSRLTDRRTVPGTVAVAAAPPSATYPVASATSVPGVGTAGMSSTLAS